MAMKLTLLRNSLAEARAKAKQEVVEYLKTDEGLELEEEQQQLLKTIVEEFRQVVKQTEVESEDEGLLNLDEVLPTDSRLLPLSFRLGEIRVQVVAMAERMTLVSEGVPVNWLLETIKVIGAHQEEWQIKFETANEASRRAVEEGGEVAPDVVDLQRDEREVGSPYNVREILKVAQPLDPEGYRTDHSSLSPQQRDMRNSLVIKDPEVGYSAAEWKKLFDKYIEIYMCMKRDGFYIGTMETFLTPSQQRYMLHTYYNRKDVAVAERETVMTYDLFCKVVQDMVDRKTDLEVALETGNLIRVAEQYFRKKENDPWPRDKTDPSYFFFCMHNFLEERGYLSRVESNRQLAKEWCHMMVRLMPNHIKPTVKSLGKTSKDLMKHPKKLEETVMRLSRAFKEVNTIFHVQGLTDMDETWQVCVEALQEHKKKKKGDSKKAKVNTAKTEDDSKAQNKSVDELMKLKALFPCVGCGGQHRFSAKPDVSKHYFVVVCPKHRGKKWGDDEVQRLKNKEIAKIKEGTKKQKRVSVSSVLANLKGTEEEKKEALKEALSELGEDEPNSENAKVVRVYVAAEEAQNLTVMVKLGEVEVEAKPVLLDSGAQVCLFGDDFLHKMVKVGAIKGIADLLVSETTYRVHGVHNHAVDTSRYIDVDVCISEFNDCTFTEDSLGIVVSDAKFLYLPGTKEVVVGRPVLEPAGLLPEQQLKGRVGEVYQATSRSVSFAVADSQDDQCATQEDVYSFFKAG